MRLNTRIIFSKAFPFFLILLPLFFVLHGFLYYYPLVDISDSLFLLLENTLVVLFFFVINFFFFKSTYTASLVAFCIMCVQFFWGVVHDFFLSILGKNWFTSYLFLLCLLLICFIFLVLIIKRKNVKLNRVCSFLNTLFLLFILIDCFLFLMQVNKSSSEEQGIIDELTSKMSSNTKKLPDVYVIIADEYAGSEALKKSLSFDNSIFTDSLRKIGFFVADCSRSNYNYTLYSMASTFGMNYLDVSKAKDGVADIEYAYRSLILNPVSSFFEKEGYELYNNSWLYFGNKASLHKTGPILSKKALLTAHTFTSRIKKDVLLPFANKWNLAFLIKKKKYESLTYNTNTINGFYQYCDLKSVKPKFVYTHLSMPHYPYYFDSLGVAYQYDELKNIAIGDRDYYKQYLKYTNQVLLKMVDYVLSNSKEKPIVIVMSDHGYRRLDSEVLPFSKYINLFSVYLPDGNYKEFSANITNVNVFRALLNTSFGQKLPYLKDTCYSVIY